jgi:galactofuranosylgalactofuranosylrhamnosyl-N-acetylglucosaminyl-diphospho-decaprenol beta-1,5/1,6-galactofuranosyltransferase
MSLQTECIQPLFLPTLATIDEASLYFRGDFIVTTSRSRISVKPYGHLRLDTYFNALTIEKWVTRTVVRTVQVEVVIARGSGQLTLFHQTTTSRRRLSQVEFDCERSQAFTFPVDISELKEGIVFPEIRARSEVVLTDARYMTSALPRRDVRLGLVITTFHREAAVEAAVERHAASKLPDDGHELFVIDNGRTLDERRFRGGCIVHNKNVGGSGGFTRGLLEALTVDGLTHALFMDDDATVHTESIQKAAAFLRYAISGDTAISGAMLVEERPSIQFEAGAQFRTFGPQPLKADRDMTEVESILINEEDERIDYGAWWFFAFPLAGVRHLAFPFFVRGDDMMFSLANRFDIVTVTGVAVWHQSFEGKVSPAVEYLGHRSDFLIGLIRAGREGTSLSEFCRAALRIPYQHAAMYRYGMANARCDAMEDVLSGPAFFEKTPSALGRMEDMKARYEACFPRKLGSQACANARPHGSTKRKKGIAELWRRLTLNGHLLPGFLTSKPEIVLQGFGHPVRAVFRRRRAVYVSVTTSEGVSVERSPMAYLKVRRRLARLERRIRREGKAVIAAYEQALPHLQSEAYWRKLLDVAALPAAAAREGALRPAEPLRPAGGGAPRAGHVRVVRGVSG